MLKGLAIVGLLLALTVLASAQEPLPVKGSQEQQHSQNQTNAAHPTAPQPCTSDVRKENAEKNERYAYYKAHPKEYLKAAVAPANLSNWILAGLGAAGALLAILTLLVIKRQGDTFVSKERARLAVELEPFELRTPDQLWEVEFLITNHGSTKAFIGEAQCLPCIEVEKWKAEDAEIHLVIAIPKVLPPSETAVRFTGPMQKGDQIDLTGWDMDQEIVDSVRSQEMAAFAVGHIEYGDVFGIKWRLRFCRRWRAFYNPDGTLWHGDWQDCGSPAANSERRIRDFGKLGTVLRYIRKFGSAKTRPRKRTLSQSSPDAQADHQPEKPN
jgi:hypothetical protein